MSDLNLEWLYHTYQNTDNLVIFDVGANNLSDSIRMRLVFPDAQIVCFECNKSLEKSNISKAKEYNLDYHHVAISAKSEPIVFYEYGDHLIGTTKQSVIDYHKNKKIKNQYQVPATTLNNFCNQNKIFPNLLHIDIEGAECDALTNLQHKPDLIWAEFSFCGKQKLEEKICKQGYTIKHTSFHDILFERHDCNFPKYVDLDDQNFEKNILLQTWISCYNDIKDELWPSISSVSDFEKLPKHIIDECKQDFGFTVNEELRNEE